ncbi:MAG: hypothetical protein OXD31_04470 [Chloroflexi bacterium]|nr:hypothetical protein [Chloroflexota bacterium]
MTVKALCSYKCRDRALNGDTPQRLSSFAEVQPLLSRPSSNGTGYYLRLRCESCGELQWILFPTR